MSVPKIGAEMVIYLKAPSRAVVKRDRFLAIGVAGHLENAATARLWAEKQGLNWWGAENHYRMMEIANGLGAGRAVDMGHN